MKILKLLVCDVIVCMSIVCGIGSSAGIQQAFARKCAAAVAWCAVDNRIWHGLNCLFYLPLFKSDVVCIPLRNRGHLLTARKFLFQHLRSLRDHAALGPGVERDVD